MPRRRPEVYEAKRQQIIDGALEVFSTQGFVRATLRDIAEAAGIQSTGLIYHYFTDKADLLRAVVERYAPPMQLVLHAEEMMALPPAEALTRLGLAYIRLMEDNPKLTATMKLIMAEALRDREFGRMFGEIGPLRVLKFLSAYLQHQMELGTLKPMSPVLAARCFVGPLVLRMMMHNLFQVEMAEAIDPVLLIETQVTLFLKGLERQP